MADRDHWCRRWRRCMLPPPKLAICIIGPIMLMI
jgi:hypothetical protein